MGMRAVEKRFYKIVIHRGAEKKVPDYEMLSCGHKFDGKSVKELRDERLCRLCPPEPKDWAGRMGRGAPLAPMDRKGRFIPM